MEQHQQQQQQQQKQRPSTAVAVAVVVSNRMLRAFFVVVILSVLVYLYSDATFLKWDIASTTTTDTSSSKATNRKENEEEEEEAPPTTAASLKRANNNNTTSLSSSVTSKNNINGASAVVPNTETSVSYSTTKKKENTKTSNRSRASSPAGAGAGAAAGATTMKAFEPMLEYINQSASKMYPEDNMPDHLWILQKQEEKFVWLQSMNTYWKQTHPFRKRQNSFNYQFLDAVLQQINQEAANCNNGTKTCQHELLYQRIEDAGGTLPFFINWRVYYTDVEKENHGCSNVAASSFPIFQRATPAACGNLSEYWTIPTAPIWKQIPKQPPPKQQQLGQWIEPQAPSAIKKKIAAVVVAVPQDDPAIVPPNATNALHQTIQELQTLQATDPRLTEQLVLLPDPNNNNKEQQMYYEEYAAVLSLDTTSSLYPTLLCQSTILLKRHPDTLVDVFSNTLIPGKHFIPVKADWSDLAQQIDYVLESPPDKVA